MWIVQQDIPEEWTAGAEDHFMGSDLLVICSGQSDICKVQVIPQLPEGVGSIGLKVI